MSRRRKVLSPRSVIIGIVVYLVIALPTILFVPKLLIENWLGNEDPTADIVRVALPAAAQTVLFALGGIVAIVGVGVRLSRHALDR